MVRVHVRDQARIAGERARALVAVEQIDVRVHIRMGQELVRAREAAVACTAQEASLDVCGNGRVQRAVAELACTGKLFARFTRSMPGNCARSMRHNAAVVAEIADDDAAAFGRPSWLEGEAGAWFFGLDVVAIAGFSGALEVDIGRRLGSGLGS